ncbi:MAG TPA: hypothetical protein ENG96_01500 [Gammaproteobacteria bacterium]|nr:hypothetical protein [Gammaproteobacteria bacterium]
MNLPNYSIPLFITLLLLVFSTGCEKGAGNSLGIDEEAEGLSIGRMRVAIWPEYDDPSLLVIYDGKFDEGLRFPIKTSFLVPKGAIISDACSLSHEGQHFCQLYKIFDKGAYDEVRLLLPYPNFYLSFHTPAFSEIDRNREFIYQIKANHPIKFMEVDIQQPLRSSAFNITPADNTSLPHAEPVISKVKGFNHFSYKLENIERGKEVTFTINYIKDDQKPSIDIKYSRMEGPKVWESPYKAQENVKAFVYLLAGTGIFGILAVAGGFIWLRKRRRRKELL